MKKLNKKQVIMLTITLLILLIGSTYAYFSIQASNNQTGARVAGKAGYLGNPSLTIKTSKLYLNLDASLMSQANAGKTYYANENENGLALTTNPNYVLATAQLPEGDEALDCTYNYKVTATVTTPITDNSDSDVKVVVGDKTMTLKELTTAGTTGIIVSGEIKNLTKGQSVSIPLTSSVTNTSNTQDKLVGNSYTIKIEPYTSGDTKAFSCKLTFKWDNSKSLADNLIASGELWQSGLEGDGYRYAGSGEVGTDTNPNNFICFGTNNKSECTANQDKYMYRVIGVFSDTNGKHHAKLVKYSSIGTYAWNNENTNVDWNNSSLYNGLNGEYFLTNTTYDYLQNTIWSNKIENWTWNITNTKVFSDNSTLYGKLTPTQVYLHEMNKTGKPNNIGEWKNMTGKIGLMYASDIVLASGIQSINLSTDIYSNNRDLERAWIMSAYNYDFGPFDDEWLITRVGMVNTGCYRAYTTDREYIIAERNVFDITTCLDNKQYVRPTFYLISDVKITGGTGSLEDPIVFN